MLLQGHTGRHRLMALSSRRFFVISSDSTAFQRLRSSCNLPALTTSVKSIFSTALGNSFIFLCDMLSVPVSWESSKHFCRSLLLPAIGASSAYIVPRKTKVFIPSLNQQYCFHFQALKSDSFPRKFTPVQFPAIVICHYGLCYVFYCARAPTRKDN